MSATCPARPDGGPHLPRFGAALVVRCTYCGLVLGKAA
jgi:hypothetical protein